VSQQQTSAWEHATAPVRPVTRQEAVQQALDALFENVEIRGEGYTVAPEFDLDAIRARAAELPLGPARDDTYALIREVKRLRKELLRKEADHDRTDHGLATVVLDAQPVPR
jgi:hypothetical protein